MKLCLLCNFQFEDEQELCPKDFSKLVPLGKDQLIGKLIQDRYRVESMLAKGSMGVVYKAMQELIGREVAIKVLHGYLVSDEESIKRFHKEAKAASRLNHPSITTLYDYGVLSSGQPYIVMDLLRGSSLAELLKVKEYLPLDEALPIIKQVCEAMSEAHKRGVVHRDIKPENIMIEYTERGVQVKVVDFGIAKFVQEQDDTIGKITKTGTVCGSPTYMSPEQCDDNQVDHRSDIYSLGVVVYETLTGKVPFSAADIYHVMTMHVKDPPPRLKATRPDLDFPSHVELALHKALAKEAINRFDNAQDFYDSLKNPPPGVVGRSTMNNLEVGGRGQTATITEQDANSVVARALEKRNRQMAVEADRSAGHTSGSEGTPAANGAGPRDSQVHMQSRRNQSTESARMKVARIQISPAMRFFGFMQQIMPALLTVALFGALLWVVKNEARIDKMFGGKSVTIVVSQDKKASVDIDDLIAANKFEQARTILEKRKREGKMVEGDQEMLNSVYVRLAKKEATAKHYKTAVSLLEQVSGEDKDDEQIRLLLKKYRKAAGLK